MTGTGDPTGFKLNDHYSPYYARKYMIKYPEAGGFFQLRHRISKDKPPYRVEPDTDLGPPDDETDLEDRLRAVVLKEILEEDD